MPGIDINYFIRQANKLTEKIDARKKELAEETFEGKAGGELVTAVVNGAQELVSIRIDPKALEGQDLGMVEDLVAAAVNTALKTSRDKLSAELSKLSGGMRIPGLS